MIFVKSQWKRILAWKNMKEIQIGVNWQIRSRAWSTTNDQETVSLSREYFHDSFQMRNELYGMSSSILLQLYHTAVVSSKRIIKVVCLETPIYSSAKSRSLPVSRWRLEVHDPLSIFDWKRAFLFKFDALLRFSFQGFLMTSQTKGWSLQEALMFHQWFASSSI